MTCDFASLAKCPRFSDLDWGELAPNSALSAMQNSLYASYMLLAPRGMKSVRNMMISDIELFLDLGARNRARDILLVLRRFCYDHPGIEASLTDTKSVSDAPCERDQNLHGGAREVEDK